MIATMSSFIDARPTPLLASRWQRALAFSVDILLVVLLTTAVGFALAPVWKLAGEWARLAGLGVGALYFGLFESRWRGGQTPGKWLTNCKLVSLRGEKLSLFGSVMRFLVFAGLIVSLGARGSGNVQLDSLVAGAVAGLVAVTVYLLIFNGGNQRGLHDLLVGSVVINEEFPLPGELDKTWRWHYLFMILALVAGFLSANNAVQQQGQNINMQPELVAELSGAFPAEKFLVFVQTSKREVDGEERESDYLVISINNPAEQRDLARAVEYVSVARDSMPTSGLMRRIVIRYVDYFHVGFSFFQKVDSFVYPPSEWERLIVAEDRQALIAEFMEKRDKHKKKGQHGSPAGN